MNSELKISEEKLEILKYKYSCLICLLIKENGKEVHHMFYIELLI